MRYTRRELRVRLESLIDQNRTRKEYGIGIRSKDKHTMASLFSFLEPPVAFSLVLVRVESQTFAGTGVAVCKPDDEWSDDVGERLATDKALDEIMAKIFDEEPAQSGRCTWAAYDLLSYLGEQMLEHKE